MALVLPAAERVYIFPPYQDKSGSHQHDELIVPVSGNWQGQVESLGTVICNPGDVLYLPAGTEHSTSNRGNEAFDIYCLMWQPGHGPACRQVLLLKDHHGHYLHTCSWMRQLTNAFAETPGCRHKRRRIRQLATVAASAIDDHDDDTESTQTDRRLTAALTHLHTNLGEQNRIKDLARIADMSTDGFIRAFRRQTGMTPGKYLQHLRIQRALALLAGSEASLRDIAHQVGYASASHLAQIIKQHTGRRPGAFRQ